MQENEGKQKRPWLPRLIALLAALMVIGGSIAAFVLPRQAAGKDAGWLPLSSARAEEWKDLKKGSSGAKVSKAQQALSALGYYTGKIDGNFSKAFEEAVLSFQEDWSLEKTGVLNEETYLLLTEDLSEDALPAQSPPASAEAPEEALVVYGGEYSDKEHVAAYLRAFRELPPNYLTKREAQALGWVSSQGNLWQVAPGKSIGGDRFGNYEGLLPKAGGRQYYECDIDYDLDRERYRGKRNEKRIIFSSDGLIFYTEDHYNTFEDITSEENGK